MTPEKYNELKSKIINLGYKNEIDWAENIKQCEDSASFCQEFIWVICNSGMKNQIAVIIYERILNAIINNIDISSVFGHKGKTDAIKDVIKNQQKYFENYKKSKNKIEFCKTLPFIGDITKYHLAKNLGENCIKPDRHLIRIAKKYKLDVFKMCENLSIKTGDKIRTVDVIIWRAANLGLV